MKLKLWLGAALAAALAFGGAAAFAGFDNSRTTVRPTGAPSAGVVRDGAAAKADDAKKSGGAAAKPEAEGVRVDGAYYSKEEVAEYLWKFGRLPSNFITKNEARRLGWSGGPVEPYAPGKAIGGDRFGNYERRLPRGNYRECDIDTKGRARGAKRLVFSGDQIYYTEDHYQHFTKVKKNEKSIHD